MKLLIAGAGGHGRVVADAAEATRRWSEIAFVDDQYPTLQKSGAWRVVGRVSELTHLATQYAACLAAFGQPRLRLEVLERARMAGFELPVLVHPRAVVSPHVRLGAGTVVFAGSVVNIGTTGGIGCIFNTGATVDHDCELADGVHVCPGANIAGQVRIGARSWIGIGAVTRQGIRIGADVTVAAGAVCVKDIRDGVTVVGVPGRERGS